MTTAPEMPVEQVDLIMNQLDVQDETALDLVLENSAKGTIWENAAQTKNSVFFSLYTVLFRTPYSFALALWRKLIPQIYVTYKTGEFLNQSRIDHDLDEFLGIKAIHVLTIVKEAAYELHIDPGTIFFVPEVNPRRFKTLVAYSFTGGETTVFIEVEALDIGSRFNVAPGLITQCETTLGVTSITNADTSPKQPGADPEVEDGTRSRIKAVKGNQIRPGMEVFYINTLLTVGGVTEATLDSVTDDGIQNYTIYGAGPLDGVVTAEAQAALNAVLIYGDKAVVQAATAQTLNLSLMIDAAYIEADITAAISTYFSSEIPRRENYESSLLFPYLRTQFKDLIGVAMRSNPVSEILQNGKYFVPVVTYEPFTN